MALPTLTPYYLMPRRNMALQERRIVQRRTHQDDLRQRWGEHSRYFQSSNVHSAKQEAWTSSKSFQNSMDAYHSRGQAEEKRRRLQEKREKLRQLLEREKEDLERELKDSSPNKLSQMKERAEELKTYREWERKKLAEEKFQDHWRANCPDLRQLESQQMEEAVHQQWEEQVKYREEELKSARREEERYDVAFEEERLAALRLEEGERIRRKWEEKEHGEALQRQMKEIRVREQEAALLEQQQATLLQEQIELEKAEEERKQLEMTQKKAEFGRILTRQYKAQMRRKCRQIQEALELDLRILEDLATKEKEDQALQTARQERAKADAKWMKKVVAEQLKLEKEREAELDLLYQEEAARMWQRRENEWEREKSARERLMAEVLVERQNQVQERMSLLKAKQAESIQHREELLREMDAVSQMTARETRHKEESKARTIEELKAQVTERRRRADEARLQYQRDLEEQRFAEEEFEVMIKTEKERMTGRGYQPKPHVKRKYAWN